MSGRTMVVGPRSGSCRQGGHDGDWHSEMVQPDEGLWVHSAAGRRQRRIRPHLRGRARGLELAQRGSSDRIRAGQQPRQAGGGKSQNALTATLFIQRLDGADRRRQQIGNILQVIVRDNNVEQALRVLKKKMQREGVFREMKRRKAYEKPSERKTREKAEAVRRARKAARKLAQREGLIPMPKRREPAARRARPPRF